MKPQGFQRTSTRALAALAVIAIFAGAAFAAGIKESVLYRFEGGSDGAFPQASLIEDKAHNLYGTTVGGGTPKLGTVFVISPPGTAWTESVLYSFIGGNDGANPFGNLVADKAGNLYGTTYDGGGSANCQSIHAGCGTVFQLTPPATRGAPWTETVLHRFTGVSDGANPVAGLIMDSKGNLYGTTIGGGFGDEGTIFELAPPATKGAPWTESVLYRFAGGNDGAIPRAGLTFGLHGALFGTTAGGGNKAQWGVVFKLRPPTTQGGSWTEGVLYRFTRGSDGGYPNAALIIDKTGNLYGTTAEGGNFSFCGAGCGTVFQVTPPTKQGDPWTETTLYSFTDGRDGAAPQARLLVDRAGNLYGTATYGGQSNNGSVFKLTPPAAQGDPWTETTLSDFASRHNGSAPTAGLIFGKGGHLYGTTAVGGGHPRARAGTVFRIVP